MMTYDQLLAAECVLETNSVEAGRERYRRLVEARGGENGAVGAALIRRTIGAVIDGIAQWQKQAADGTPGRLVGLAKFISQFEADEVAFITLRHVVSAMHRVDTKLAATAMSVAGDLEAIDLEARLKTADIRMYWRYVRAMKGRSHRDTKRLALLKQNGQYLGTFGAKSTYQWSASERLQVGVRLLEIVMEHTDICELRLSNDPGGSGEVSRHHVYFLAPTEATQEWIDAAHDALELDRPVYFPMVVPPVDWQGTYGGGYLSQERGFRRSLMKLPPGAFGSELKAAAIPKVMAAINILQRVPYAVNAQVLAVVKVNIEDGSASGLPTRDERRELPPRHPFMDRRESETWTDDERALFKEWKRATSEAKEANNRLVADARTTMTTVSMADQMSAYPAIYYPLQLDFRGRAYPVPAYLQPQGSDLAKGLLTFATAVPLGPDGIRWLAVHTANAFGGAEKLDKQAFDVRVRWTREHHDEIVADAEDPHRPHALWVKAESPFQFLAAAFEWAAMARHAAETGSVETFESRLPVGLDGSCNGLQHFSAMLRDPVGGTATNLVPADRPADIYSLVADEVRKLIELDLASDDPDTVQYARFWTAKGITRKWTKRNTMTLPYGVTRRGMADQLWAEVGRGNQRKFFGEQPIAHGKCVEYLASKNWVAIGSVVVAARSAMDWLHQVARACSKAGAPVVWSTPDGLPVLQKYHQRDEVKVSVTGRTHRLVLTLRPATVRIDAHKQAAALAPNFVHSVDAAHMRAVARRLDAAGITSMLMVHDSFAVPAGHVESLARIVREEFVVLHSQPLLQRFLDGILPSLPDDHGIPPVPEAGSLDLAAVLQADYFFA